MKDIINQMKAAAPAAIAAQAKVIKNRGAHGEITLIRVDSLPEGLDPVNTTGPAHILAHSESGHHHVMEKENVEFYKDPEDAFQAFIRITGGAPAMLYQERGHNPHGKQYYEPGIWKVVNAREMDLAGEIRKAMD